MNERIGGVITIVVTDEQLRLELVKDVGNDVDVLIAPDNPRWEVMMGLLGDELRNGPIICESKADVDRLVARISNKPDVATVVDGLMKDDHLLDPLRLVLHSTDMREPMTILSNFSEIPLHHRLNQHPTRPGKQQKSKQPSSQTHKRGK